MSQPSPDIAVHRASSAVVYVPSLPSLDLPELKKRESLTGDQCETKLSLWSSEERGTTDVGVWECTPGKFRRPPSSSASINYILDGTATLISATGETFHVQPGDAVVLPAGWSGSWEVHQTVRKFYAGHRYG